MGRSVQTRLGNQLPAPEYFDNSAFCKGYRARTITTEVPAPECWDEKVYDVGYHVPVTVTEKPAGFPWWIVLAAAGGMIVLKKSK